MWNETSKRSNVIADCVHIYIFTRWCCSFWCSRVRQRSTTGTTANFAKLQQFFGPKVFEFFFFLAESTKSCWEGNTQSIQRFPTLSHSPFSRQFFFLHLLWWANDCDELGLCINQLFFPFFKIIGLLPDSVFGLEVFWTQSFANFFSHQWIQFLRRKRNALSEQRIQVKPPGDLRIKLRSSGFTVKCH